MPNTIAAKEIKGLITDSVGKVADGGRLVEQSGQTLQEIVVAVKKASDIVAEMAAAAREQASGIEQVNKAILQMDQVTQQNAALVEETASASQSMGDQAKDLQNLMGFFKLTDDAVAGRAAPPPPPSPARRELRPALRPAARAPVQAAARSGATAPASAKVRPLPVAKKTAAAPAASEEWAEF